jgi:hypothetical protein
MMHKGCFCIIIVFASKQKFLQETGCAKYQTFCRKTKFSHENEVFSLKLVFAIIKKIIVYTQILWYEYKISVMKTKISHRDKAFVMIRISSRIKTKFLRKLN